MTKNNQYIRFSHLDGDKLTMDAGYPADIISTWWGDIPDSFKSGIDSMVKFPDGKTYVIKGDQYVRYSDSSPTVDPGYPRPIKGNW